MSLIERAMSITGLSEEFCRTMVIKDMMRKRGLIAPAPMQETQDGDTASTSLAKGD